MSLTTVTKPLIDLLKGDATVASLAPGGVWLSVAPPVGEAGARPVVVIGLRSAPLEAETMVDATGRIFRYVVYVEGAQQDITTVRALALRIHTLLHRVRWDGGASWQIVRSVFTEVVEEAAVVDGQFRLHRLGGVLEVWADHT